MDKKIFLDFMKITKTYELKYVARKSSSSYFDSHLNKNIVRGETTAEHVYSSLKLTDYMISNFDEFKNLDKLKVYELLMYHDDCEIEVGDICVSNISGRIDKEIEELKGVKILSQKYPDILSKKLLSLDLEYRDIVTDEAIFCKAIDKMDAMIHELRYPLDWGIHKGFGKSDVNKYFRKYFEFSPIFLMIFEELLVYLKENNYFEKE
jgi:5'-deoxynucleotidase YfbR-like HD superfamily hydrolase